MATTTNFNLDSKEQEINMGLKRAELFEKYGFKLIQVGQRVTVGSVTMGIKFSFDGFKYFFQGREAFFNWIAKAGLAPARYIKRFPKRRNDTYITSLTPNF